MAESVQLGTRSRLLLQGGAASFRLSPFEGIVLLAVLSGALFGGYTVYARTSDLNAEVATPPTYIPAFRTSISSSISTTGSVLSTQQVTLTFGTTGKIKEFLAGLGAQVVAGQPLARIDDTDLQQSLRSAQSSLDSNLARYNAALAGPELTDVTAAQQGINTSRSQLATAQQSLADLRAKPTPTELATAQQGLLQAQSGVQTATDNVAKAQADLLTARTEYDQALSTAAQRFVAVQSEYIPMKDAYNSCNEVSGMVKPALPKTPIEGVQPASATRIETGICTPSSALTAYNQFVTSYNAAAAAYGTALTAVTTKQTALTNAQNAVNSGNLQRSLDSAKLGLQVAEVKLSDTRAGPKQSEFDAAQRSIDSAQGSLDSATAKYNALFDPPRPETTLPLLASVEQSRTQLETAKQNLAEATIVAPFAGQISQVVGEVGSQVGAATTVFILLNPRLIRIDANVDQSDITNLRKGQTANVTFDALQGRIYQATISAIGLTPTVQQGVVTYVVTFGVDTGALPATTPIPAPGMTATLTVTTSQTSNALVVPARSIRRVGRTSTVRVRTASGAEEERTITTGATNGTLTQVLTGLSDGDEVLVSLGTAASTPTQQRPTTGAGGGQFPVPAGR